jgi:hypothetical protein
MCSARWASVCGAHGTIGDLGLRIGWCGMWLMWHVQRPLRGGSREQGPSEKMKRENDVHLRQLAKKSTYVRNCFLVFSRLLNFLVRFGAFLGKGTSKTRDSFLSTVPKVSPGKYFFGEIFFPGRFFKPFFFRQFLLRW